ncbi:plasmid pRiA4b ORF-3 family protein [Nonomuraea sp. NPDC000554]|uniref:plasmid pRiA4b ORF-3 family protein n=1 Tax=Nonomuraea sp. NPDC000554 TaxID=3154259 RepID=UPI003323A6D7
MQTADLRKRPNVRRHRDVARQDDNHPARYGGAVSAIHQLKVTLRDVHPPVWRRIHVPSTAGLLDLHNVVQIAMGWQNYHLHLFAKDWTECGVTLTG